MSESISEMLDLSCIDLSLTSRKKIDIINELVTLIDRGGKISDANQLATEIIAREKLFSTGIGSGIAIPHTLSTTVTHSVLAFGRKEEGARFDSVDNLPVTLFFLLVGPEGSHAEHLRVLSRISRYLHDRSFCEKLREAATPQDVLDAFGEKEQSSP